LKVGSGWRTWRKGGKAKKIRKWPGGQGSCVWGRVHLLKTYLKGEEDKKKRGETARGQRSRTEPFSNLGGGKKNPTTDSRQRDWLKKND